MVGSLIPPGVVSNVKMTCSEVVAAAKASGFPVRNVWGYGEGPDHNNRRCIDYMITSKAGGDWLAAYLWQHRARLGLQLMIWNRSIRRTYRKVPWPAGAKVRYRGDSPHTDHVHSQQAEKTYLAPKQAYLGPYEVSRARVSTFLWQIRPDGTRGRRRAPGFRVETGVAVIELGGRQWLRTVSGNRYALEFLDPVA